MTQMKKNLEGYFPAFGNLMNQLLNDDWMDWNSRNFSKTNTTVPAVNVKEDNDKFVVELAAPGMHKEDFKVELHHNLLTIASEKKEEKITDGERGRYTRREFSYQSFVRSFSLPDSADGEKIAARYENGVLSLEIPKHEVAKVKPLKVIEIG